MDVVARIENCTGPGQPGPGQPGSFIPLGATVPLPELSASGSGRNVQETVYIMQDSGVPCLVALLAARQLDIQSAAKANR
jgi:hypothetical protein